MEELMESKLSDLKLVVKNMVLASLHTHFMHIRVKDLLSGLKQILAAERLLKL